ncbi:MAG TPA: winged helix-turn-helix domain-containing protein [Casimicrobiaceae bacterium]|nr:winged helix-turn-helix domain-containing protein [Casimicrobiaceae bacterium]
MTTPTATHALRFGRFELQPHERRLLVAGDPAALGSRALDLLQALAERAGQLVSKHALMDLVWPDVVVEENNLAAQISALRKVVGGDVIATIPGRGYRFTAKLDEAPAEEAAQAADAAAQPGVARERNAGPPPSLESRPVAAAMPTNLPGELTTLLGRDDDLAVLGTLIEQHRVVTIVGAGGMGKTLLAQHLLDSRRSAYPHGVCWVELAQVSDPAALPGTIAAALGVHGGTGEPLAGLVAAVAPLSLLLALDNAEHLLADVARVCDALRDAAPGVRLIVTSQAQLRLAGERVYRIGPLAVPDRPLPAAQAMEFGAVALFTDRARAADARFALTDANAPAVIALCRALDGLALATELAAARVPMLGVRRLASSMQDRLKLLNASRNRAAPARQQTLRAALEWSHGFLDEREQLVFRRLAVFAGSASLELIQQVVADPAGEGELDEWAVLDALGVLVDRSLVAVLSTDADDTTAPRYRLLESPRAYALERLVAAGEHAALKQRHALAIATRFDAAWDERFDGSIGVDDWNKKLSFDLDNAREALAWASTEADVPRGLAIGATLLAALPLTLHAERSALADRLEALISPAAPEYLQQRAWEVISGFTGGFSQRQRCRNAAQRAVDLARGLNVERRDPFYLCRALGLLAQWAATAGESDACSAAFIEMRALEDPSWPPHRLALGVKVEVGLAKFRGNAAEYVRHMRRRVAVERASGIRGPSPLVNLIDAQLAAGDATAAARDGAQVVAMLERLRDESTLNLARLNLTAAWLALDELEAARLVAQVGWQQAARFDLHHLWANYLTLLAALEGRPDAAARLAGYADAAYLALDDTRQPNEAAAIDRAHTLARAALGDDECDRLRAEGTTLRDADIAALAFATR